jgi:hypothetical protein
MREVEPAEDLVTQNELIETELATPYEMRNRVEESGSETEDDRVEPVREANEEIENEREAVLDVVANEGARFQVPPILYNEVSIEGTENFRVPPERRYVPGPRSSKRLRPGVSGDSPP